MSMSGSGGAVPETEAQALEKKNRLDQENNPLTKAQLQQIHNIHYWEIFPAGEEESIKEENEDIEMENSIILSSEEVSKGISRLKSGIYYVRDQNTPENKCFFRWDKDSNTITVPPRSSRDFSQRMEIMADVLAREGFSTIELRFPSSRFDRYSPSSYEGRIIIEKTRENIFTALATCSDRNMAIDFDRHMQEVIFHLKPEDQQLIWKLQKDLKLNQERAKLYMNMTDDKLLENQLKALQGTEKLTDDKKAGMTSKAYADYEETAREKGLSEEEKQLAVMTQEMAALDKRLERAESIAKKMHATLEVQETLMNSGKLGDPKTVESLAKTAIAKGSLFGHAKLVMGELWRSLTEEHIKAKNAKYQNEETGINEMTEKAKSQIKQCEKVMNAVTAEKDDIAERRKLWEAEKAKLTEKMEARQKTVDGLKEEIKTKQEAVINKKEEIKKETNEDNKTKLTTEVSQLESAVGKLKKELSENQAILDQHAKLGAMAKDMNSRQDKVVEYVQKVEKVNNDTALNERRDTAIKASQTREKTEAAKGLKT